MPFIALSPTLCLTSQRVTPVANNWRVIPISEATLRIWGTKTSENIYRNTFTALLTISLSLSLRANLSEFSRPSQETPWPPATIYTVCVSRLQQHHTKLS